ncbi:uncharacterized protein BDZ99DRAFT_461222 [Mytilinidion resinicola]|uniref:Defect at low temperature protein 1 n=1 Tax=Mytilinidion resinicola TaxID=574789 RepID=A0A6A6YX48_9PEZI|nr:uncharacterized protein BDZ99DRAFT_461222 [Mytilinidion resinicola]KAF2812555.1 hypothetical protein BDZ99DRAFT_461222 [Mytilinidion resinicola]
MHIRIRLFRIWYSTTYTVLFFLAIVLLAVTPADTIYQSIRSDDIQKIFVVAGVYLLTFLITILIYSTRLYTNRSALQGIPKPYLPIEDGEVGKLIRRLIVKNLKRSAIVAWDSRPRELQDEELDDATAGSRPPTAERQHTTFKRRSHLMEATVIPVSAALPAWGEIAHPGWSSPSSDDLPNLQFWTVIPELPNLIEAKAVSLAPPDPAFDPGQHPQDTSPILPDAQVVALLQRPATMGLRDYLSRLSSFGLINPPTLGAKFLTQYEFARFSNTPLTEHEFRELMAVFADILSGMTELDAELIANIQAGDIDSDALSFTSSVSTQTSTGSAIHYRTPRVPDATDSYYTSSTSSDPGRDESPGTIRTAASRFDVRSSGTRQLSSNPSANSLRSQRFQSMSRSPSSTVRGSPSLASLRSTSGAGELPYHYDFNHP